MSRGGVAARQRPRRAAFGGHDRNNERCWGTAPLAGLRRVPGDLQDKERGLLSSFFYEVIHLGDALIALESLYRYLRKFHALADQRYVLLSFSQLFPVLFVLLSLEFMPRRRRLPAATGWE